MPHLTPLFPLLVQQNQTSYTVRHHHKSIPARQSNIISKLGNMERILSSLSISVFLTLLLLISPLSAVYTSRHDLLIATEEMQRANYFTFVLLLNMSPPDKIPPNITFLMPNDRMLSKTAIPENAVSDFLLRHSIPSALLFDHLQHFPSNSLIPSSSPDYMIKILNNGRRSYFLNNVKLISPNLCVNGSSVRCHGIDGVLVETSPLSCSSHPALAPPSPPPQSPPPPKQASAPPSPPPQSPPPPKQASPPSPSPLEAPPVASRPPPPPPLNIPSTFPGPPPPVDWTPATAPGPSDPPTHPKGSGGALSPFGGGIKYLTSLAVILVLYVFVC